MLTTPAKRRRVALVAAAISALSVLLWLAARPLGTSWAATGLLAVDAALCGAAGGAAGAGFFGHPRLRGWLEAGAGGLIATALALTLFLASLAPWLRPDLRALADAPLGWLAATGLATSFGFGAALHLAEAAAARPGGADRTGRR